MHIQALMLLSHQHIAQAEMVYVYVCVSVSTHLRVITVSTQREVLTFLNFYQNLKTLLILSIYLGQYLHAVKCLPHNETCEVAVQTVQKGGEKKTLRGLGVPNVRNYCLT